MPFPYPCRHFASSETGRHATGAVHWNANWDWEYGSSEQSGDRVIARDRGTANTFHGFQVAYEELVVRQVWLHANHKFIALPGRYVTEVCSTGPNKFI